MSGWVCGVLSGGENGVGRRGGVCGDGVGDVHGDYHGSRGRRERSAIWRI